MIDTEMFLRLGWYLYARLRTANWNLKKVLRFGRPLHVMSFTPHHWENILWRHPVNYINCFRPTSRVKELVSSLLCLVVLFFLSPSLSPSLSIIMQDITKKKLIFGYSK